MRKKFRAKRTAVQLRKCCQKDHVYNKCHRISQFKLQKGHKKRNISKWKCTLQSTVSSHMWTVQKMGEGTYQQLVNDAKSADDWWWFQKSNWKIHELLIFKILNIEKRQGTIIPLSVSAWAIKMWKYLLLFSQI